VPGCEVTAGVVIYCHGAELGFVSQAVHQDGGDAALAEEVQPVRDIAYWGNQQALDALLLEEVDVIRFAAGVVAAVPEQHGAALEGGCVFGGADHGGEEGVAHVQDNEADGAAVANPELAGGIIADEAQLVDGTQDPFLGPLRYPVRVIQDVRDRSHGHARVGGDVLDTGCPVQRISVLVCPRRGLPRGRSKVLCHCLTPAQVQLYFES